MCELKWRAKNGVESALSALTERTKLRREKPQSVRKRVQTLTERKRLVAAWK